MTNEEALDLRKLFEQMSRDYYGAVVVGTDVRYANMRLMDSTSFILAIAQLRLQSGKSDG